MFGAGSGAPIAAAKSSSEIYSKNGAAASGSTANLGDGFGTANAGVPTPSPRFTTALLNPPYRKIQAASPERGLLRRIGVETSNLYTAFLAVVTRLLVPGGEMVALTPRSYCNGPYFRAFRRDFLGHMTLWRVHLYDSRTAAFHDDSVLQENSIMRATRNGEEYERRGRPAGS
mgnify:CR=1 FL=1